MKFTKSNLDGVWIVDLERREDERGFLARVYCEKEFRDHGLCVQWPQANITLTRRRGMIRGLHFQADPKPEIKLVRCLAGSVFDVVVDVRPASPTFGRWEGFELSAANGRALYISAGFAHGFQCLEDSCQLYYHMSEFYYSELARGIRWNDPKIGIGWPIQEAILNERDKTLPLLEELT